MVVNNDGEMIQGLIEDLRDYKIPQFGRVERNIASDEIVERDGYTRILESDYLFVGIIGCRFRRICQTTLNERSEMLLINCGALRLTQHSGLRVFDPEPCKSGKDIRFIFILASFPVGIFKSEIHGSFFVCRKEQIEKRRASASDVEIAGRTRRETRDDVHTGSCSIEVSRRIVAIFVAASGRA